MPRGRTGYEIIRGWFKREKVLPVEKQFTHPLDAKIGTHVRFSNVMITIKGEKDVDLTGELFQVTEIWVWERTRHGTKLSPMADYVMESGDKKVVLRVIDTMNRGKPGELGLLLLTQHWPESDGPYPWGEDSPYIIEGCMDNNGQFTRHLGTENEEVYFRDLSNVHCKVSRIHDANMDGTIELDEVEKLDCSLWTFRRDTDDEHHQQFTQHLHVQLSGLYNESTKKVDGSGDRTILMLAGESVPTLSVTMY